MLKALELWRLRFNEKHDEGRDKFGRAFDKRRPVMAGLIGPSEAMTGRVCHIAANNLGRRHSGKGDFACTSHDCIHKRIY